MRRFVQIIWIFLINGHIFPFKNKIYIGPLKSICAPGLNCYSCPLATLGCPIGGLQHFMSQLRAHLHYGIFMFGFYIWGSLMLIGAFVGRMACGWACPFGLLQEMIYKLPTPKYRLPKALDYVKYVVLVLFVLILPAIWIDKSGYGRPWFCRFICPAGTLEAGLPLLGMMPNLRVQVGWLFYNKLFILVVFLTLPAFFKRPFCHILCPLGAFYGLFNKISFLRIYVDQKACHKCDLCYKHCPMGIRIYEDPNQLECIRCLTCREVCPYQAISLGFGNRRTQIVKDKFHTADVETYR